MNCPFCHKPVGDHQTSVQVGDQRAHASCVQDDAARQSRPFRERVGFDDRGPDDNGRNLKERISREIRE